MAIDRRITATMPTMMMRSLLLLLLALLLLPLTSSLDIQVTEWSCNETLPVYATEFAMTCNDGNSTRCTFGQSASFEGVLMYDGIYNTNVQNNLAYLSGDMTFTTLHYDLFDKYEFDLCYDGVISAVENEDGTAAAAECPNDGQYGFSVTYGLPSSSESAWLATGFVGKGYLYMYADSSSQEELISSCEFTLQTLVTPDESKSYNPPTARTAGIVLLSLLGVIVAALLYCTCCRGRRRRTRKSLDDDTTTFVRMQDDQLSTMGNRSTATSAMA